MCKQAFRRATVIDVSSADSTACANHSEIYVGVTGNIGVVDHGGVTTLFTNVPVGYFKGDWAKILTATTTASGLVALK